MICCEGSGKAKRCNWVLRGVGVGGLDKLGKTTDLLADLVDLGLEVLISDMVL